MLWYVMLCYGMYVMVGIYVCNVCTVHIYYIYTHTHKRTLEYIQLLFGLHSLRHAMIILLSHLISIKYSNCFQPDNHHQTIKPQNQIIKSSTHHHHYHPAHRCYHYPDSTLSLYGVAMYMYM